MSPNESQLRAALRDGEGASLDVDVVVAGAIRAHRARRQRVASVAGAIAVVAGVAVGVTLVGRGGDPTSPGPVLGAGHGSVSSTTGGSQRPGPSPLSQGSDAPAQGANPAAATIRCPSGLPRFLLPGGGGTTQFGSDGALFAAPVVAMKVCGYPAGTGTLGASRVLTGRRAGELVASLESAATTRGDRVCPDSTTGVGDASLAIYGVTASGQRLHAVTVTLGCPSLVTNGTAARYYWLPPSWLSGLTTPGFHPPAIRSGVPTR
ncbi:MAG: hypothetical protein M3070_15705 [Actinomycetota bacterium]|nr:hypothetical protein [Actinomycetota bacterium]